MSLTEFRLQVKCTTLFRASLVTNLVFNGDLSPQGVVSIPLFREGQSMFDPFILSLQGSGHLTGLGVGRACAFKFLQMMVTGVDR